MRLALSVPCGCRIWLCLLGRLVFGLGGESLTVSPGALREYSHTTAYSAHCCCHTRTGTFVAAPEVPNWHHGNIASPRRLGHVPPPCCAASAMSAHAAVVRSHPAALRRKRNPQRMPQVASYACVTWGTLSTHFGTLSTHMEYSEYSHGVL